jgi:hypothetical protein
MLWGAGGGSFSEKPVAFLKCFSHDTHWVSRIYEEKEKLTSCFYTL